MRVKRRNFLHERLEGTSRLSPRFLIRVLIPCSPSNRCYARPVYQDIDRRSLGGRSFDEGGLFEIDARRSTWRRVTLQIYSMTTIVKGSERWVGQGQGVRGLFRYPTPDTCSIPRLVAKNPWRVSRHD